MGSSLSTIFDNLAERIHKIKCKYEHDNKKFEACGIKYKDCEFCLEYINAKDNLILCKCLCCNKNYQKDVNANTYKFSNHEINKLFCCFKTVFTHINTWIFGKNSIKYHKLKKKIFTVT